MSQRMSSDFTDWNELGGLEISQVVATEFKTAIAESLGLDPDTVIMQDTWLIGTILSMSMAQEDFQKLRTKIRDKSLECGLIHGSWFEENDHVLYLQVSTTIDFWQCVRTDRYKGSFILSMANSLPADSPHRLQIVKIISAAHAPETLLYEGSTILPDYSFYQLLVHFLRMFARLNPHDIARFIGLHSIWREGTSKWAKIIEQGPDVACRSMLRAACDAVKEFPGLNDPNRALTKILTPDGLARLDAEHQTSYAERSFHSKWGVVVHFAKLAADTPLRRMHPSFFVAWPKDLGFGSQVHIIDTPVRQETYCMLLSCSKRPSGPDIADMRAELGAQMGIPPSKKDWATDAFEKSDGTWLRADGVLEKQFKDGVIYPELRALLDAARPGQPVDVTTLLQDLESNHLTPLGPGDRESWTIVLLARESDEDGNKQRRTSGLQLTKMMRSKILLQRRPHDRVYICVESCSSHKHPWKDRCLPHSIPRDRPIRLITPIPDRGTRRADEVDTLRAWAKAGWYTQGLATGEGTSNEDWRLVEGDAAEVLKQRLIIGRQRALHGGFRKRADMVAARFNDANSRLKEVPPQVTALRKVIKQAFDSHGFLKIMLIGRSCPRGSGAKELRMDTSMIGQFQFMRNAIPEELRKFCVEWKAEGLSVSRDDFNNKLEDRLATHGSKVLLITVRLDHATGAAGPHDRLRKICSAGGHAAMSLIWDHKTRLTVPEALLLDDDQSKDPVVAAWADAFDSQIRAPMLHVNWPPILPHIWILGDNHSDTAHRHVKNAEEWSQAMQMSSYPGDDYMDPGFSEKGRSGKGYNDETRQGWNDYVKGKFEGEDIWSQAIFSDRGGAFECSCSGDPQAETVPPHDDECQCRCAYCDDKRACPCDRKRCVCPPLCNCHCRNCHQEPHNAGTTDKDATASGDESDPKPNQTRICRTKGCGDTIHVEKLKNVYCTTCILRRKHPIPKCRIPECDRDTTPKTIYRNVCKTCSLDPRLADQDPKLWRKCAVKGCKERAPKGGKHGTCCSSACTRTRKGAPVTKRKRELADVGREQGGDEGGNSALDL